MAVHGLRSRQWSLVTYASVAEFAPLLNQCEHYAYIYHDKDGVEPHFHILCVFKNPRALKGIQDTIKSDQNTLGEPVKSSLEEMYKYLTHERETDKVLYPKESVVCDSVSFWETLTAEEGSITDSLIDDILQGLPLRLLARRYGRDYMRNFNAYKWFAQLVYAQEHGTVYSYQRYAEMAEFRRLAKENPDTGFEGEHTSMDMPRD
mgnify:FL=1